MDKRTILFVLALSLITLPSEYFFSNIRKFRKKQEWVKQEAKKRGQKEIKTAGKTVTSTSSPQPDEKRRKKILCIGNPLSAACLFDISAAL